MSRDVKTSTVHIWQFLACAPLIRQYFYQVENLFLSHVGFCVPALWSLANLMLDFTASSTQWKLGK